VFIALGMQYAMRMGHIVTCGMCASIMFPHHLINGKISKKEVTGHKTCVLISSKNLFETFLTVRRTERDMIKMFGSLHEKCLPFLSDLNVA
jgi:hypothetical protein